MESDLYRIPGAELVDPGPVAPPGRRRRRVAVALLALLVLSALLSLYDKYSLFVRIGAEQEFYRAPVRDLLLAMLARGVLFSVAAVLVARVRRSGVVVSACTIAATAAVDVCHALVDDSTILWYPIALLALFLAHSSVPRSGSRLSSARASGTRA